MTTRSPSTWLLRHCRARTGESPLLSDFRSCVGSGLVRGMLESE